MSTDKTIANATNATNATGPTGPTSSDASLHGRVGLLLTGGGARTAYQAGVLQGVAELTGPAGFPYRYLSGSSAGSINAAYLASRAEHWPHAAGDLCEVWKNMSADKVFSTEMLDWYMRGARWISWLALSRFVSRQPDAILDNTPLIATLRGLIDTDAIARNLSDGFFEVLGIGASSYTTGRHVTFYQTRSGLADWQSADRMAVSQPITIRHLAASSAIPFVFSPVSLTLNGKVEWFGDGTMRQSAPLMPLVEAGASRILAISVSPEERASMFAARQDSGGRSPTLAQVAGHALASVFYDALPAEIDQIERINAALALLRSQVPDEFPFKPIQIVAITPSEPIEEIALRHVKSMPPRVRSFLKTFGATESNGIALASYLLFEPEFTAELIELGKRDAYAKATELKELFSADETGTDAGTVTALKGSLQEFFRRFTR
ncbi:MAG: patatin-like phospholipase family protein [Burkholderiaceae bacterium]